MSYPTFALLSALAVLVVAFWLLLLCRGGRGACVFRPHRFGELRCLGTLKVWYRQCERPGCGFMREVKSKRGQPDEHATWPGAHF